MPPERPKDPMLLITPWWRRSQHTPIAASRTPYGDAASRTPQGAHPTGYPEPSAVARATLSRDSGQLWPLSLGIGAPRQRRLSASSLSTFLSLTTACAHLGTAPMLMGRLYGFPLGHTPLRQGHWCSWRCACQGEPMLFSLGIAVLFVVLWRSWSCFWRGPWVTVVGVRRSPDGSGASRAARRTGDGLRSWACGHRLGSLEGGILLVARVPC
jgi:hypothetical protein